MDELVRWLGEQLDEDERLARAATQGDWVWSREFVTPPGYHHRTVGPLEPGDAAFIAAHDPARVLRELDAKRNILEDHRPSELAVYEPHGCPLCHTWPCPTIRWLASVYADRPGYREEWRP